ncbi:hypothetical protein BHM03_00012618 [Ensete ventricosum]|nr:hypothetical protein BHM03_00012618 [Ensete ventricosum]
MTKLSCSLPLTRYITCYYNWRRKREPRERASTPQPAGFPGAEFEVKNQTYPKNPGTGDSPVDLGGSTARNPSMGGLPTRHGWFNRLKTWVVVYLSVLGDSVADNRPVSRVRAV